MSHCSDLSNDKLKQVFYFLDEAGDTTFFNRRGVIIVGNKGCSNVFMIGLSHCATLKTV